ncbi:MAG: hypothetical protein GC145_07090 [Caulobacter sp.]|nr:hypothetical protein [Caulobacter sp.]
MRNLLTMIIAAGATLAITDCIRRASDEDESTGATAKTGTTLPPPIPSPVATGDGLAAANRLGPTAVI